MASACGAMVLLAVHVAGAGPSSDRAPADSSVGPGFYTTKFLLRLCHAQPYRLRERRLIQLGAVWALMADGVPRHQAADLGERLFERPLWHKPPLHDPGQLPLPKALFALFHRPELCEVVDRKALRSAANNITTLWATGLWVARDSMLDAVEQLAKSKRRRGVSSPSLRDQPEVTRLVDSYLEQLRTGVRLENMTAWAYDGHRLPRASLETVLERSNADPDVAMRVVEALYRRPLGQPMPEVTLPLVGPITREQSIRLWETIAERQAPPVLWPWTYVADTNIILAHLNRFNGQAQLGHKYASAFLDMLRLPERDMRVAWPSFREIEEHAVEPVPGYFRAAFRSFATLVSRAPLEQEIYMVLRDAGVDVTDAMIGAATMTGAAFGHPKLLTQDVRFLKAVRRSVERRRESAETGNQLPFAERFPGGFVAELLGMTAHCVLAPKPKKEPSGNGRHELKDWFGVQPGSAWPSVVESRLPAESSDPFVDRVRGRLRSIDEYTDLAGRVFAHDGLNKTQPLLDER